MTKNAPVVEEITDFEVLEVALRELAIEKGLFTQDHRRYTEFAEEMWPAPASRLVAEAWADSAFKKRALEDPIAASLEVGINWLNPPGFGTSSDFTALQILEYTPTLHHVVTCTLCSCYPRPILGNSLSRDARRRTVSPSTNMRSSPSQRASSSPSRTLSS